jgi:hypothetical protein
MAKILSGILGHVSGKVAGVVGGTWKGKAYIRAYAKPGNPNTGPQQTQRGNRRAAVAAAKPFVSQICNAYTDRFTKGMSGFNWIVKNCIKNITEDGTIPLLAVASGPLHLGSILTAVYVTSTGVVTVHWDDNNGVDGLPTDSVVVWLRDITKNNVYFNPVPVTRTDGSTFFTCPTGLNVALCEAGVMFYQQKPNSPTIINKISDSNVMQTSAS